MSKCFPFLILLLLTACIIGPQPLPTSIRCETVEDLSIEVTYPGQVRITGRIEEAVEAAEALNLDDDAPAHLAQVNDDGSFAIILEGAPLDRFRVRGSSSCCDTTDAMLTEEGSTRILTPHYECISGVQHALCCGNANESSCRNSWSITNRCEAPIVIRSATPRSGGESIALETELPLEIEQDERGTVVFTMMGGAERVSEVFFIDIDGAEEATIAVSLQSDP